jgi:hypothetical protein
MIALVLLLFPLLGLGTLLAMAMSSEGHHEDRWALNESSPCCEERGKIPSRATTNFASSKSANSFLEFDRDDIAA